MRWIAFVCLFVAWRIALRAALLWVFGRDPVDDVGMFAALGGHPIAQYLGAAIAPQFPPLFGLLVLPVHWIKLLGLGAGDASRIVFSMYELALVAPFARRAIMTRRWEGLLYFSCVPPFVCASTIFVQDEIISAALLFYVLLKWADRAPLAPALSVLFVAAKIFFAPLAMLAVLGRRLQIYGACAAIVVLGYFGRLLARGGHRFVPGNDFGVSLWSESCFSFIKPATMMAVSVGSIAMYTLICLALATRTTNRNARLWIMVGYLLGAFALFYHTNPEYYVIPFAIVLYLDHTGEASRVDVALHTILATLPYVHNVLHGLAKAPKLLTLIGRSGVTAGQDLVIAALFMLGALLAWRSLRRAFVAA